MKVESKDRSVRTELLVLDFPPSPSVERVTVVVVVVVVCTTLYIVQQQRRRRRVDVFSFFSFLLSADFEVSGRE